MNRDTVVRQIQQAFAGVSLGDGIGLWQAQAIDDYETLETRQNARAKDEHDDWSRLSAYDLQRCYSSLSFFDAEGMRFHLPAYIIASLESDVVDEPVFHLIQLDDYSLSKLELLDSRQRQSIISYLYWCLEQDRLSFDHPSIEHAMLEYWLVE